MAPQQTGNVTWKTDVLSDVTCNNLLWTAVQCCPFGFAQELDRFAAAFMEMSQSLEQVSSAQGCWTKA